MLQLAKKLAKIPQSNQTSLPDRIEVYGIIFEGRILPQKVILSGQQLEENELGGLICKNYPFTCPRCKKKVFMIWKEKTGYVAFCLEKDCLKIDSDKSKNIRAATVPPGSFHDDL